MDLTILISCKDEAEALGPLTRALAGVPDTLGTPWRCAAVLVDDGSTDATAAGLRTLAETLPFDVTILGHRRNRGLGAAWRTASAALAGDIVVTYDADRPYPLEDLPKLIAPITAGTADVVTASPWHADGAAEDVPWHRSVVSRAASLAYRLRLGRRARGLHTITCGYRAWRRETFQAALPDRDGFTATAEMLLNALRNEARVAEVPSVLRHRTEGESKMRVMKTTLSHLGLLIRG